mgnify:CR=1 FL=1
MEDFLVIANKQMDELESLLSKNDGLTCEEDDKVQELYQAIKDALEMSSDIILGHEQYLEMEINELHKSQNRFMSLCENFDTPDDIIDAIMKNMFPDEDSMEGFDWTYE